MKTELQSALLCAKVFSKDEFLEEEGKDKK